MIAFVNDRRAVYGVEPICRVLPIAPSTYYRHVAERQHPDERCARAKRDEDLSLAIQRIWAEHFQVYDARKVWRQLRREGFTVARCTVERLMRRLGLQGVIRGRVVRTTFSDKTMLSPLNRMNRQFRAERPNQLWVAIIPTCRRGRASSTWPS
ncbi:hypothetical protein GCM10010981_23330 [Dyella nitratireducens]|uniref:HTH-like domain-containing protein n=1 Tax=Dyella nitratireducens TaxID=1849580 RepID=A0ABQ1FY60_9GAMM|nr:hypothetical protein GCM10010981_23330 [Dyella nitratireducens]GLQ40767.1 hypothetical protein GCM10007902_06170 [Dyella nitratireducens]